MFSAGRAFVQATTTTTSKDASCMWAHETKPCMPPKVLLQVAPDRAAIRFFNLDWTAHRMCLLGVSYIQYVQNAWKLQRILLCTLTVCLILLWVDLALPLVPRQNSASRLLKCFGDHTPIVEVHCEHMAGQRRHVGRRRRNGAEPDPPPFLRSGKNPGVKTTFSWMCIIGVISGPCS
jgi:hypothetical protein